MEFAVEVNGERRVIYTPLPHQEAFHLSPLTYFLMEGGRGSGKSICMRMDAYMMCWAIPKFRALIVRRTMPELKQSHLTYVPFEVERMGMPKEAWHATDFLLRFPNGSTLRFGHVEDDNALPRYLSSEYERIYFDELTTFTQKQFLFLCSSLRSPIVGYKPNARAGTNPVGPGAGWVKRWFLDKRPKVEELEFYDPDEIGSIHADMDENTYVDRTHYEKILNMLPSDALRRALRHGEWVTEGQMFSEWKDRDPDTGRPWHVITEPPLYQGKPIWCAPHIEVVRVIDWGYATTGNPGVCLWFACLTDGSVIAFREWVFKETLPKDAAKIILDMSRDVRVKYTVMDTACWQEHEGPSIAEQFSQAGLSPIEADKARTPGWIEAHRYLRTVMSGPSGQTFPMMRFYVGGHDGCQLASRTIPEQLVDPKDPNDIVTVGVEDDCADVLRYFCMSRPASSQEPVIEPSVAWVLREIQKRKGRNSSFRLGPEAMHN